MTLQEWADKWGVPPQALKELAEGEDFVPTAKKAEAMVQANVRYEACRSGARLWRNNVGAYQDERGHWVRYGLCNESKAMNQKLKSSDLIGLQPIVVTQAHVGQTIGQFMAREVKRGGWKYTGTSREKAQLKFGSLVTLLGGDFKFVS